MTLTAAAESKPLLLRRAESKLGGVWESILLLLLLLLLEICFVWPPSGPILFLLRRNGGRGGVVSEKRRQRAEVMITKVNALVCVGGDSISAGDVDSALTGEAPKNTEAAGDGHGGA